MNIPVIYCIENLVNGKKYIGSSINYKNRFKSHKCCLRLNKHQNDHLQSAWNKYGEASFEFKIVLQCDINDLEKNEIYFIKKYYSSNRDYGYNMDDGGMGTNRIVSKETRNKLSNTKKIKGDWSGIKNPVFGKKFAGKVHPMQGKQHNQLTKDKIGKSISNLFEDKTKNPMWGKKHTEEAKQKMREKKKNYKGENHPRYGKKHTEESILKMINSHTGKTHSKETKQKMSLDRKGKKLSAEHKRKIKESLNKSCLKGKDNPRYGKRISEETKAKMSIGKKLSWQRKKEQIKKENS